MKSFIPRCIMLPFMLAPFVIGFICCAIRDGFILGLGLVEVLEEGI